jgi:hypothetical protein
MTNSSILVDVCGAIELLDGVSIVDSFMHSDGARIEFTVTDSLSRLILVQVAEAANVNLNVWAQYSPSSKEAITNIDKALFYRLSVQSGDVIDSLKWLGAHLSWQLLACGIIDSKQEKILCKKFNAKSRSA